jgi:lysyl-tRNA synthetase class 1
MYIVESGITPSGVVHAGNFREVFTQDFVYKALVSKGVQAKYQYFWDDYDRFRKVPRNVPAEWEQYIGMPASKVPDPEGCHKSYADHFIALAEDEANKVGVECEYLRASELYPKCVFAEGVKEALEKKEIAREIINQFRREPHGKEWMPTKVYCEVCEKDNTEHEYLGDYKVHYKCECGHEDTFNFREKGLIKLKWRVDWAMRWKHYSVDFESSGKEHHASGGSWDTCSRISERLFEHPAPIGPMYEFINVEGAKMASSVGNVTTITQLLGVYEAPIVRYLYLGKLSKALEIPFGFGLSNTYNYYDKLEREYFEKESVENEREKENVKAQYELAQITPKPWQMTVQPDFGFCASVVQVAKGDDDAIRIMQRAGHLENLEDADRKKVVERLGLARNWVAEYAPDAVKFTVLEKAPAADLSDDVRKALALVADDLDKAGSADAVSDSIKHACELSGVKPKEFFQAAYTLLLGRPRGPRLAGFLLSLDKGFVQKRLKLVD